MLYAINDKSVCGASGRWASRACSALHAEAQVALSLASRHMRRNANLTLRSFAPSLAAHGATRAAPGVGSSSGMHGALLSQK